MMLVCLVIDNSEAKWRGRAGGTRKEWYLNILPIDRKIDYDFNDHSVPVCLDGILVAGTPGRPSYRKGGDLYLDSRNSFIYSTSPALINARGDLKPEITPGRTPPESFSFINLPPRWQRLSDTFNEGLGLLWEQLAQYHSSGLAPETFWKLGVIRGICVWWVPPNTLWNVLSVSLINTEKQTNWRLVRKLGEMSMCQSGDVDFVLQDFDGARIGPDENLDEWEKQGEEHPCLAWRMNSIVLLTSSLHIRDGEVVLTPSPPSHLMTPLAQYAKSPMMRVNMFLLDYVGDASDAIAVQTPFPTANRNHGLAKISHESRYTIEVTDLQSFARAFVPCIAESLSTRKETPSLDETSYWQKRVGHLYFSVQWDQYDATLRPPYKMWTKDKGWFSFLVKDFARWRDSPVKID